MPRWTVSRIDPDKMWSILVSAAQSAANGDTSEPETPRTNVIYSKLSEKCAIRKYQNSFLKICTEISKVTWCHVFFLKSCFRIPDSRVQKRVSAKLRQTARHVRYLISWPPKSDPTRWPTRGAFLNFKFYLERIRWEMPARIYSETRAAILILHKVNYSSPKISDTLGSTNPPAIPLCRGLTTAALSPAV